MKKIFLIIVALIFALDSYCQNTPENNLGFNILLEGEGMGSTHYGMGGISVAFGSQLSPNFFVGVGVKQIAGGVRGMYRNRVNNSSQGNVFWIDSHNNRYKFHGWDQYEKEVFFDDRYDINNWEKAIIRDENGNILDLRDEIYDDELNEDGSFFEGVYWKFVPFVCLKVDLLPKKEICPYIDARIGMNLLRSEKNAKYCTDASLMLGSRIAFGESNHALLISAGWNRSDMRGYDDYLKWEDAFMVRIGVEF